MYIFDHLEVLYITDDLLTADYFCGYNTKNFKEIFTDKSYDKIIICDFDKTHKERRLQEKGLAYKKDYLFEEDFFSDLDDIKLPADRKLVVWGTGKISKMLIEQVHTCQISFFIDSNKSINEFSGHTVLLPEQINDWNNYFIIIAVSKDTEIRQFLLNRGLIENVNFVSYRKIIWKPSSLLRTTIFDNSYYDLECNTMLNHLEILSDGNTRSCCCTFVQQNLDNILEKGLTELWSSNLHKIMCLSTENRTFSFCDKNMCPLFANIDKNGEKETERQGTVQK